MAVEELAAIEVAPDAPLMVNGKPIGTARKLVDAVGRLRSAVAALQSQVEKADGEIVRWRGEAQEWRAAAAGEPDLGDRLEEVREEAAAQLAVSERQRRAAEGALEALRVEQQEGIANLTAQLARACVERDQARRESESYREAQAAALGQRSEAWAEIIRLDCEAKSLRNAGPPPEAPAPDEAAARFAALEALAARHDAELVKLRGAFERFRRAARVSLRDDDHPKLPFGGESHDAPT